jgi:hypothetical protein
MDDLTFNEEDHDFFLQKASEILERFNLLEDVKIDILSDVVDYLAEMIVNSVKLWFYWKKTYHYIIRRNDEDLLE